MLGLAPSFSPTISIVHLCAFKHHAFQDVGRVFSFVRGGLQDFIQFFELDQGNRVFLFLEQDGDGRTRHAVGLIFQAIDFNAVFQDVVMLFAQTGQSVGKLVGLLYNQAGKQRRSRRSAGDLVHYQTNASGIDEVENVIERGSETVYVFAIEWSDEGLVEL